MKIREWFEGLPLPGFVKDIIFVAVVVGAISLLSQLILGVWTPMVAVESGSMVPNLNIGDIIVVQGASRTEITPWDEAEDTGYKAFNLPGDVILYRPYGKEALNLLDQIKMLLGVPYPQEKATPIIHRALRHVDEGEPMWEGGPGAPFPGYITKGDHNEVIDQQAGRIFGVANESYIRTHQDQIMEVGRDSVYLDRNTGLVIYKVDNGTFVGEGISYLTPVRDDWVIGVARVRIPLVGYVRLLPNIIADQINKILGRGS
ncbi:MAG TPA: S26 family signal peptidase [Methanotrichaceae archaeon]|nr:S26 family signal peptidase [Methanotrichaceae archaeon]